MLYEIKDIYGYTSEHTTPMLSNFTSTDENADFWKPYKDNYTYFDRMFMKKYRSWYPMDQDGTLAQISTEFAGDVKAWLMINDKRYSELFRIQSITDDDKYTLTDNVYESETIETSREHDNTFSKGAQIDTQDNERVTGRQEFETDATNTTGSTGKTITESTSAFNDSAYTPVNKSEEDNDSREDIIDETVVNGSRTDTEDLSRTFGAREDEDSGTESETIERLRQGNIGVKDVPQMLGDQRDFWVSFSFFEMIFAEIARELLRGGVY